MQNSYLPPLRTEFLLTDLPIILDNIRIACPQATTWEVMQAMEVARAVRESISLVEHITGHTIDVMSLSYNRMMNHIRYMVARAVSGEKLKVNMNDYMSVKFPEAFRAAKRICEEMEKRLKLPMEEIEIGYLAMHIERIMDREEGE